MGNNRDAQTVKIGPRVPDVGVWEDFKEYCKRKNGKEGTAGAELVAAMRNHMDGGNGGKDCAEIEQRLDLVNTKLDYLMKSVHSLEGQSEIDELLADEQ